MMILIYIRIYSYAFVQCYNLYFLVRIFNFVFSYFVQKFELNWVELNEMEWIEKIYQNPEKK